MQKIQPVRSTVIAVGLALTFVGVARAAFNPVPITPGSYTADVVVEKTATPVLKVVTTASVDQGTNNGANTWMEVGFDPANPGNGLPAPGTVITAVSNANYSFQMPPSYTAPNGILINATQVTNGTLTLTVPAPYTLLSFLGSGGNGGDVIGVTVRHLDGSIEGGAFPCPDWFSGTSNVAFVANERCGSTVNFTYANQNSGNPRLYFRDVPLTNASPVTNLTLYYVSGPTGSHNDVLAVSGATTVGGPVIPIPVTGFTYDFVVEAGAAKRARVVSTTIVDSTNVWATSQSMDNIANTGNAWYEQGYNLNNPDGGGVPIPDLTVLTNTGLPAAGSTITNAAGDHVYTLAPDYKANNAVWVAIDPAISNATITLVTPTAASVVSFLASAGNGPVNNIMVVTHHADTTTETNFINVANWFDGTPFVYGANGRVAVDTAQFNTVRNTARNPRLYPVDYILANTVSPVTTIDVINTNTTGGRIAIFAVSSTLGPVAPSFVTQPQSATVNLAANVQFTATAVANVAITYQWQKGTNGVFANLADGGNISGVTTTTLSVNNVGDADDADYRLVATDSAGSVNSSTAVLTVLSDLLDVTQPGDSISAYQPNGGSSNAGEDVTKAIDNVTQKYLNNGNGVTPLAVPVGFTVTPSMGRTKVTAMRFYAANDAPERDPANYVLQGSDDGGATWTLIVSNIMTMPDGRNAGGAIALNPLAQAIRQVRFANANGYTQYRWFATRIKGNVALFQIAEVELLGVADTSGKPNFTTPPASVVAYAGSPVTFNAAASGTPAPGLFWKKGTNGVYVGVSDGPNISGAQTGTLSINAAQFSDAADYICVATNTSGSSTSLVATLTVISTLTDVTVPGDPITAFGDESLGAYGANANPAQAIDNAHDIIYRNGGSGPNASATFPPFEGPVGVAVTPAAGATLVSGLRVYTAIDVADRDPADYKLEGSNNGGTSYTTIASGALALPAARANSAQVFDPTLQPMQEVLFPNHTSYTTYRLTFTHVKGDAVNVVNSLQIGEFELLGVAAPGGNPTLTITVGGGGTLNIASSVSGTLQSTTDLTPPVTWFNEGPVTAGTPVTITPSAAQPRKYYRVVIPVP